MTFSKTTCASLFASAIMAGAAFGANLNVNGTTHTIPAGDTENYSSVNLSGGGIIATSPGESADLNASTSFNLQSGSIGDRYDYTVNLGGKAGLIKTTNGVVTLGGYSTYSGATSVEGGTLQALVSGAFSENSAFTVKAGALLDVNNTFQQIGSLAGAGNVNLGANGNLYFGRNNQSTTFSGVISDRGYSHLGKEGTGTTILTGENTLTGGISVEGGTLQIGNGVSGSIANVDYVDVYNNATLAFNLANNSVFTAPIWLGDEEGAGHFVSLSSGMTTITGEIYGDGDFTQAGKGKTILVGNHSYTGSTYIKAGTLQLGNGVDDAHLTETDLIDISKGGTLELNWSGWHGIHNDIVNNGTILVSSPGNTTISGGSISGSGNLVINSDGWTLLRDSGAYTYTGATIINRGTLETRDAWVLPEYSAVIVAENGTLRLGGNDQSIGSLSGAGLVVLDGANLTVGSDNKNAYFSGTIDNGNDYSTINKVGHGTWILDGINWQDYTRISEGAIVVGSHAGSHAQIIKDVEIKEGATLAGHGTIGAVDLYSAEVWNSGGTISPGFAGQIGTLTITGDYIHDLDTPMSTVFVKVASRKSHDLLSIGGGAWVGNGKLVVAQAGRGLVGGDTVTILTAENGRHETFDKVESAYKTMLTPKAIYGDDFVAVTFEQGKFSRLSGLSPNEKAVARGVDSISGKGNARKLIGLLDSLPIGQVPGALAILSPEQLASIFNIGFAGAEIQNINIEHRLDDVRNGCVGFSASGLSLTNSHGSLNYDGAPISSDRGGLSLAGWDGKSVVSKNAVAPVTIDNRWGFFATGSGEWADIENTRNERGSNFTTGGFTLGADYRVSNNLVVGISGGYANTSSDLQNDGRISVNSGKGSVYGTLFGNGFYVNTLVGGGYNSYDTKRKTLGGFARGTTDGGEFNTLLGGGYDYTIGGFSVGPVASVQYTYLGLSSFQENGSDAPMLFPSQNQNSLKTALGARASYTFNLCGVAIKPEVRAQWQHEYLDSTAALESQFAAGGTAFTVNGPTIGRDSLLVDAGVSAQFTPALGVFAYYTGEIGRSNYSSNRVNGGFRISF